ncbi:MAG TPA: nucleoside monophosphate kinase [Candidatus Paceibacterota bacterium]|nr:nucleoside monophosphate kinase [Candidatus Paceibacterota bacterium]
MVHNYIFVGPQGSGKGTQAKIVAEKFNLCHISTGDLLRNLSGSMKEKVDEYMNSGQLVPDCIVLNILKQKLDSNNCENGFILDGFPRNIGQANELDKIVKIDAMFSIEVSNEEVVRRINGRRFCSKCTTNYNIYVQEIKPKKEGVCDKCGGKLLKRDDDNEEAIKKRLEIYFKDTQPLLRHYNTIRINGEQTIEKVNEDIMKAIKMLGFFR